MKKGDKVKCVNRGGNFNLTDGREYVVLAECVVCGDSGITVLNDDGNEGNFYARRFEVVVSSSLQDDIEKGKSMLGKKVQAGSITGVVEEVYAVLTEPKSCSYSVEQEFKKLGYAVVLKWGVYTYGLSQVELLPDSITLRLTKDYEAKVYTDKVVVGCQTITREALDEVVKAMEKLNQ